MNALASAIRLDKWLWAARFYKTRNLAAAAIKGGKIHIDGQRIKASKTVAIGQRLSINKPPERFDIVITALSDKRQSANIAQMLYAETPQSAARREKEAILRKLARQQAITPHDKGRPTKRNRRQIDRFTHRD